MRVILGCLLVLCSAVQTVHADTTWLFSEQTGTALHETGDNFAFGVLPNGDVVAIKKSDTGTKSTEVHILDAKSGYKKFRVQTGTALHETGDNFAFGVLPYGAVVAIKKSDTGTKSTELHVLYPYEKVRSTPTNGGGKTSLLQDTALIHMRFKYNGGPPGASYDQQVTWAGELVSSTGSVGDDDPFYDTKQYQGKTDGNGEYVKTVQYTQRRPGKWKLSVRAAGWTAECEVDAPANGQATANFTYNKPRCTTGPQF